MLAAIRRASSSLSNLAAERRFCRHGWSKGMARTYRRSPDFKCARWIRIGTADANLDRLNLDDAARAALVDFDIPILVNEFEKAVL